MHVNNQMFRRKSHLINLLNGYVYPFLWKTIINDRWLDRVYRMNQMTEQWVDNMLLYTVQKAVYEQYGRRIKMRSEVDCRFIYIWEIKIFIKDMLMVWIGLTILFCCSLCNLKQKMGKWTCSDSVGPLRVIMLHLSII